MVYVRQATFLFEWICSVARSANDAISSTGISQLTLHGAVLENVLSGVL